MEPDVNKIADQLDEMWQNGATPSDLNAFLEQQGFTEESWKEAWSAAKDADKPSRIGTAISQAAEGATFGLLNEMVDPFLPGQPVKDYLQAGEEAYPGMSMAADLTGGVGSGILAGVLSGGAATPSILAKLGSVFRPSTLGGVRGVAQNMGRAATVGAVEGAARSDNRVSGGLLGAAAGGVASPVMQLAGRTALAAGRGARSMLGPTPAPAQQDATRGMRSLLGLIEQGPYAQSADPVAALRSEAEGALQSAGSLADVVPPAVYMGDTGQGVAVGVAQGGAREAARESSTAAIRDITGTVDSPGRLMQSLARGVGLNETPSGRVIAKAAELQDETRKVAEQAYDGIFARNTTPAPKPGVMSDMADWMRRNARRVNEATRYARETFEGNPEMMDLPDIVGGDTIDEWIPNMTLRQGHRIRQGLSRMEERAIMQGDKVAARELTRARNTFAGYLDELFPEYGPARAQIADSHEIQRAFDLGAEVARKGERTTDEFRQVQDLLADKTSEQARMFVLGAVSDVVEDLMGKANTRGTSNIASRLQRRQEVFDRVARLFPDDQAVQDFLGELDAAFEIGAQPQRLVGGSQTYRNQEAAAKIADSVATFVQSLYNPGYGLANFLGRTVRNEFGVDAVASANRGLSDIFFGGQFTGPQGAGQLFDELAAMRAGQAARRSNDQVLQGYPSLLGGLMGGRASGLLNR